MNPIPTTPGLQQPGPDMRHHSAKKAPCLYGSGLDERIGGNGNLARTCHSHRALIIPARCRSRSLAGCASGATHRGGGGVVHRTTGRGRGLCRSRVGLGLLMHMAIPAWPAIHMWGMVAVLFMHMVVHLLRMGTAGWWAIVHRGRAVVYHCRAAWRGWRRCAVGFGVVKGNLRLGKATHYEQAAKYV